MSQPDDPIISVLVADDDEDQRVLIEQLLRYAEGARHVVTCVVDGRSALTALREQVFDVALLDLSMPGLDGLEVLEAVADDPTRPQVVFVSGRGTVETATRAMKLGAFDFLEKPVDGDRLLTVVWNAARAQRVLSRTERLEAVVTRDSGGVQIVTEDQHVKDLLHLVARIAPSDVSVLIVGESGTGKELIARELHRLSGRHAEPLVALNCAAVAELSHRSRRTRATFTTCSNGAPLGSRSSMHQSGLAIVETLLDQMCRGMAAELATYSRDSRSSTTK